MMHAAGRRRKYSKHLCDLSNACNASGSSDQRTTRQRTLRSASNGATNNKVRRVEKLADLICDENMDSSDNADVAFSKNSSPHCSQPNSFSGALLPTSNVFLGTSDIPESPERPFPDGVDYARSPFSTPSVQRMNESQDPPSPLPAMTIGCSQIVWDNMSRTDAEQSKLRNMDWVKNHPVLGSYMRAILFEWLLEVCETLRLHRETYHLAIHYMDCYMGGTRNVTRVTLQLLGITCLSLAAKMEEIYPPSHHDLAELTDGACQQENISLQEVVICRVLDWDLLAETAIGFLKIYMQSAVKDVFQSAINPTMAFLSKRGFSKDLFVQVARLIDLSSLDSDYTKYKYSQIAAAALSFYVHKDVFFEGTAMEIQCEALHDIRYWMFDHYRVLDGMELEQIPFKGVLPECYCLIQMANVKVSMMDNVRKLQQEDAASKCEHAVTTCTPTRDRKHSAITVTPTNSATALLLTPPDSTKNILASP